MGIDTLNTFEDGIRFKSKLSYNTRKSYDKYQNCIGLMISITIHKIFFKKHLVMSSTENIGGCIIWRILIFSVAIFPSTFSSTCHTLPNVCLQHVKIHAKDERSFKWIMNGMYNPFCYVTKLFEHKWTFCKLTSCTIMKEISIF